MKTFSGSGFTLAELIVVITILAILATVGFLALSGYSQDAKDSAVKTNVHSVYSAILSEAAITGNSPRYYVSHDAWAALSGAFVYFDGYPVALVGGTWNAPNTNYSAGNPDWTKLKLSSEKFKTSSLDRYFSETFASYDSHQISIGAVDYSSLKLPTGRMRSSSWIQAVALDSNSGKVSVFGNYPAALPGSAKGLVAANANVDPLSSLVEGGSPSGSGSCPSWFVKVPENSEFSQPEFCLAKYEMKFADTNGKNQSTAIGWKTWDFMTWSTIASKPDSLPITSITQGQAISACSSIGPWFHLVTNNEWMSVARNIESVWKNWTSWIVWNWGMYRWNNGSWSDSLWCDDAWSDYVAESWPDSLSLGPQRRSCSEIRQLELSNGEVVWDMAGGVWEHVNWGNSPDGTNYATMDGNVCSGADNGFSFGGLDGSKWGDCGYRSPYSYAWYWPKTSGMNSTNGVGRIYSSSALWTTQVLRRWWEASALDSDGVWIFAMSLRQNANSTVYTTGFRCAYRKP